MCVRCGTGRLAWCTDPDRHGDDLDQMIAEVRSDPVDRARFEAALARDRDLPRVSESDAALVDHLARALSAASASENHAVARYDMPVYGSVKVALSIVLAQVYDLDIAQCNEVLNILAELGPDDAHRDAPSGLSGIASYAWAARAERN